MQLCGKIAIGLLQSKSPSFHAKSLALFTPANIVVTHKAGDITEKAQPLKKGVGLNIFKALGAVGNHLNNKKNCTIAKGNSK